MTNRSLSTFDAFLLADSSAPKLENYTSNGGRRKMRYQAKKESEFWLEYTKQLNDKALTAFFAEIVPEKHAVVVIFNVSYNQPEGGGNFDAELYSTDFSDNIVITTQNTLTKVLGDDASTEYNTCIFVASKTYKDDDDVCHVNYRLHFPLCRMENSDQQRFLRADLLTNYRKNNVVTNLAIELTTTKVDEIASLPRTGDVVPLYGSSTFSDNRALPHITLIYNASGKIIQNWEELSTKIDYKAHDSFKRSQAVTSHKWSYWLPIVLSITYQGGEDYFPKKLNEVVSEDTETIDEMYRPPDQTIALEMMSMIPSGYANRGWKRKLIGKALYNVFQGRTEGCDEWINWCRSYKDLSPYEDDYFIKKYRLFSGRNPRRIVTLQQIAQQENPTSYRKWFDDRFYTLLQTAGTSRTPVSVAELANHYFRTKYTCVGKQWFMHTGSYLKAVAFNRTHLTPITARIKVASDQEGVPRRGATLNYEALLKSMETPGFLGSVKSMLMDMFHTYTEGIILNSDGLLTATAEMKVIEILKCVGCVERRGLLEDYLTRHSEVCLDYNFSETDQASIRERDFSYKLLGSSEAVDYMDLHRAKDFRAPSGEKSLEIHMGPTNSGKTTNLKVDKRMFGDNQLGHMATALTSTQSHGGPSPETAHTNFMKRVVVEDPDDVDTKNLNEGWLLRETGQANRLSRFLNENGGDSEASGNYIYAINDPIAFSPTGQMQIRLFVFWFISLFLTQDDAEKLGKTVPKDEEEQRKKHIYPRANFTEEDWSDMARVRLNRSFLLMQKMNWKSPLDRPQVIKGSTRKYWMSYDPYTIFKSHYLQEAPGNTVTVDLLYNVFVVWYKQKFHTNFAPNYRAFKKCMKGVLCCEPDERDLYHGFRIEDPVFSSFISQCLCIGAPDAVLDVHTAWDQFRTWCINTNMKSHAQNMRDFIIYMSSSVTPYIPEIGGFAGYYVSDKKLVQR